MVKAFESFGAIMQYTELPGVDHNASHPAYDRADLIE
jgi:hypothetical protein